MQGKNPYGDLCGEKIFNLSRGMYYGLQSIDVAIFLCQVADISSGVDL